MTGETRCAVTELFEAQCAHCRKLPDLPARYGQPRTRRHFPASLFLARHYGHCVDCDGRIFPGDHICADGAGGYQCAGCADEF